MTINNSIVNLIETLLYEHDCIIIPNFGGFVVNVKDFEFNAKEGKIYPRKRWIAFNERLRSDDGILATAWAKKEGISHKVAFDQISQFSQSLKDSLKSEPILVLPKLGTFSLTAESKISFLPNPEQNFDLSQFGLLPVALPSSSKISKPILLENPIERSMTLQEETSEETVEEGELLPRRISTKVYVYALVAFLLGGLSAYYLTEPNSRYVNSSLSPFTIKIKKEKNPPLISKSQLAIPEEKTIATDSSILPSPNEPSVEIRKTTVGHETNSVFLVAASFQTQAKAELAMNELKSKGFDQAVILPKEADAIHFRVSIGTEASMEAGYKKAAEIKSKKKLDIWVYKP
ncbi:HU domain-containing protein [Aquirufa salirivi]|uniref:SPOR domain-containing protein n=1 Tax=Aquirufa salirivi TaxID=3104729 RepID=A0ABW8RT76_9BACT